MSKITNISLNSIKDNHVDMTVYEYIEDKVKAVKNYARSNTIRNYMSVFLAALRENWDSEIITIQNNTKLKNTIFFIFSFIQSLLL